MIFISFNSVSYQYIDISKAMDGRYIVSKLVDEKWQFENDILFNSTVVLPTYVSYNGIILKTQCYPDDISCDKNAVAMNQILRTFLNVSLGQLIKFEEVKQNDTFERCGKAIVQVEYIKKQQKDAIVFDEDFMIELLHSRLCDKYFYDDMTFLLKDKDNDNGYRVKILSGTGIFNDETDVQFIQDKLPIQIVNSKRTQQLFRKSINLMDLGIGGLNEQFETIFRKAFASRMLPKKVREELGINHVRGMLLYGPPGTGKTKIARELGKLLNCSEPKVVNGPSLLNKYVGSSEENVRKLFADAISDNKAGVEGLHLIICDEFDAVARKRGLRNDGTGTGDQVVNQFLTMIDGVDALDNILLICMTNRKDIIDEALLRPGRLEVQIEISLPDEKGRVEILKIYTRGMMTNGRLSADVDVSELARKTVNMTGAELEGLVRTATSYAISREISLDTHDQNPVINPIVCMNDFDRALLEIKPQFGQASDLVKNIWERIDETLFDDLSVSISELMEFFNGVQNGKVLSLLLHGVENKTYLSCHLARLIGFPTIQIISTLNSSFSKSDILEGLDKCRTTKQAVLILDDLEGIIQWNDVGNVYDNSVFQTIRNTLKCFIQKDQQLIIIANTGNYRAIEKLGLINIFSKVI